MVVPILFKYDDTDTYANEISEIYSYSEEPEFRANQTAFEEMMEDYGLPFCWKHMVHGQKVAAINRLMTTLEVATKELRLKACRSLAYLIQGTFGECLSLEEQAAKSQEHVFLLYSHGIFQAFVQQLLIEANLNHAPASTTTANQSQDSSTPLNPNQPQTTTTAPTTTTTTSASSNSIAKPPTEQTFADSSDLRMILSVLCTITETMYHVNKLSAPADSKLQELRQQFILELQSPFGDELLSVTLFQMLNSFCGGLAPHYPVRKITLLLWKVILITLGGSPELRQLKEQSRKSANLAPSHGDTIEVADSIRPCSPPVLPTTQNRGRTLLSLSNKRKVFQQHLDAAIDEIMDDVKADWVRKEENKDPVLYDLADLEGESAEKYKHEDSDNNTKIVQIHTTSSEMRPINFPDNEEDSNPNGDTADADPLSSDSNEIDANNEDDDSLKARLMQMGFGIEEPEEKSDQSSHVKLFEGTQPDDIETARLFDELDIDKKPTTSCKGLPWAPKVRKADLSLHISSTRQKFLGYILHNDLESTFGLPEPIIEGINVLRKHLYVSLSEVQLEREEATEKYPLTFKELDSEYREKPAEKLYVALLPKLPQYMIALLKILLAASSNAKNKAERTESINIMSEMLHPDDGDVSYSATMKMNADIARHKEVVIKAVSAILILLLKHFKINHIYQFEYISQQLMFANCIPLILKFLSQDIYNFVVSPRSTISIIDFPACVIGEQPELSTEAIEICIYQRYTWRNMFSCINLVRILNKLTKWKHSRIMMLVVFKSSSTLTKALSISHPMLQLYVLKLLKVQLKFLGRQWKKTNMKLISAIYQMVRHRLTDDWAYSNDNEASPWDFQAEEFSLQGNINKFHQRRYHEILASNRTSGHQIFNQYDKYSWQLEESSDGYFDNSSYEAVEISPNFERHYEKWLDNEVFQRHIEWDRLLAH